VLLSRRTIFVIAALVAAGVFLINRAIVSSLEKSEAKFPDTSFQPQKVQHELVPDNPKMYKITVRPDGGLPGTQIDWYNQMAGIMISQPADFQLDPATAAARLRIIDRQIRNIEGMARNERNNPENQARLQNLYMLRATLKSVETKK